MASAAHTLWIDCDTGIDDALALLYVLGDPRAEVAGVSTVAGNCPLEQATQNTLRVLALAGARRVPVHRGAAAPLRGDLRPARAIHGDDGLGGCAGLLPRPAARPRRDAAPEALPRALRARPGAVTILATGPLTNLALALEADPEAAALAHRVVVMGGAVTAPGNLAPVVEFNIGTDPEAARAALTAAWPVTLVGLDVTRQVLLGETEARALEAAGSPVARFCAAALRSYAAAYERRNGRALAPAHDPLAAAVALDPALVRALQVPLDVETRGELTRGMTVADLRVLTRPALLAGRRVAQVCVEVDAEAATRRLLRAWGA